MLRKCLKATHIPYHPLSILSESCDWTNESCLEDVISLCECLRCSSRPFKKSDLRGIKSIYGHRSHTQHTNNKNGWSWHHHLLSFNTVVNREEKPWNIWGLEAWTRSLKEDDDCNGEYHDLYENNRTYSYIFHLPRYRYIVLRVIFES